MVTQEQRELRDRLIDYDNLVKIRCDWVDMDAEVRYSEQKNVEWYGDFELPKIGEHVAVWPGCVCGVVADYGIKRIGSVYERAVWVKLDNSEFVKLVGKECRSVTDEERQEIELRNAEFKRKLVGAGKKVERQRKERRQRQVKGSHLLDQMMEATSDLTVDEKSSFFKITGPVKGRAVYLARKGGRVDLSGFCVDHDAIVPLTPEEARKRHLGKVRGQINFDVGDSIALDAYFMALSLLRS